MITERFTEQCSPVINSNYDTCGTVTRSTVDHLTATDLATLFAPGGLFADLDAWFFHSIEMKACGVRLYAWYDWIMANADRTLFRGAVSGIKTVKGPSLMHPFILAKQESVVNRDYWRITNGWTTVAYDGLGNGVDDYPLSDAELALYAAGRVVRLESRHSVPVDEKFFRSRDTLHIFNRRADGQTQHGQWKIYAAANNAALGFCDVLIQSENAGSDEPYDATPTAGVVIPGINNVNDYESWCHNLPTLDPRKRVPFWRQVRRSARCVDSEYRTVYKRLYDANPAFKEFGDLDLAERNRQDELEAQKRFVNAFFFQKPLANQTKDLWESLEAINTVAGSVIDPGLSGKIIARRANWVGVREQLRVCDRVFDIMNQPLNFYEWLDLNYDIMRARKSQGRKVTDLDWFTNNPFAANMATAFMTYYKNEYLDQLRLTMEVGKTTGLGMQYNGYYVKYPAGVKINIVTDEFFDDWLDEHASQDQESVGNLLLCLDIGKPGAGTIYYALIASNRKVYTTAEIDQLAKFDSTYRCTMATISIEQTLMSEEGTVVVECPLNSAWVENFRNEVPILTGKSLNPSYENLY